MSEPSAGLAPEAQLSARGLDDATVIDGEAVVFAAGELHHLNSTATLIWQSCDGRVSLRALAGELAETFGASLPAVLDDVLTVAAGLHARGLVHLADEDADEEGESSLAPAKPMVEPPPICSGCGDGPSYDVRLLVDIGDSIVTVGADAEVADALTAAFDRRTDDQALGRVVGRAEPSTHRPAYGVVLPPLNQGSGPQEVARLHRGPEVLFRSRDPERVLRALVAQISSHFVAPGQMTLDAVAVGRSGLAVLVPIATNRVAFAHRAHRCGLFVADAPVSVVAVDPPTVMVGSSWDDVDFEPLAEVAAGRRPAGTEPEPLPWDRHDLVAIAVGGRPDATGVLGELGSTRSDCGDTRDRLAALRELVRSVPVVTGTSPETIAAAIVRRDR